MSNQEPNSKGWARQYVEAEQPIPEAWRMAFYEEISSDDEEYRKSLEASIHKHGVRWN